MSFVEKKLTDVGSKKTNGLVKIASLEKTKMYNKKEELAELEHDQWAHWTKYMLDNLTDENIARWRKQIDTPYRSLSEKEKDSDREWADKVLEIIDSDGAYFVSNDKGKLVKKYFKLSDESKQEIKDIEKKIRGDMTDEQWEFFKTIRC